MPESRVRRIIRSDGTIEVLESRAYRFAELEALLKAEMFDTVILHDGMVMIVDDAGHKKNLPRNELATQIYLSGCRPGTDWFIAGDVAILPDSDYGTI